MELQKQSTAKWTVVFIAIFLTAGCSVQPATERTGPSVTPGSTLGSTATSPPAPKQGEVWAWGYGEEHNFGGASTTDVGTPVRLPGFGEAIAVSTSPGFEAIYPDGTIWQIGRTDGFAGDPNATVASTATQITGLPPMMQIAPISQQALAKDGKVWAWGDDNYGQFGDLAHADTLNNRPPAQIDLGAVKIVELKDSTARTSEGAVIAWGCARTLAAVLHSSDLISNCFKPTVISGIPKAVEITESLALTASGEVWDFESGTAGPQTVAGLPAISHIFEAGGQHFAQAADGKLFAWGFGKGGELGDGKFQSSDTPVPVTGISHVTSMGRGGCGAVVASDSSGNVWAWGGNTGAFGDSRSCGEYGTGLDAAPSSIPVQVPGLKNVIAVSGTVAIVASH